LLAVPVFYSLFEDIQESTVFSRAGAGIKRTVQPVRVKLTNAFSHFTRKTKKAETDSAAKTKDVYVD
jgi:hypothetical protein